MPRNLPGVHVRQWAPGIRQHAPADPVALVQANVFGHAKLVPKEAEQEAAGIMFARHPQMKAWAALAHTWAFYEIGITDVRVLDFFGGYHRVTPEEYFAATPREPLLQAEPLPR